MFQENPDLFEGDLSMVETSPGEPEVNEDLLIMSPEYRDSLETIRQLKARLIRRTWMIDEIRKSYLRDVVTVKHIITDVLTANERQFVMNQFDSYLPSLDMKQGLQLYAPAKTSLSVKLCNECGGHLEIVMVDTDEVDRYKKIASDAKEREARFRVKLATLDTQLEDVTKANKETTKTHFEEKRFLYAEVKKAKEDLAKLQEAYGELKNVNKKIKEENESFKSSNSELFVSANKLAIAEQELEQLSSSLNTAETQLREVRALEKSAQKELAQMRIDNNDTHTAHNTTMQELVLAKNETSQSTLIIQRLSDEIKNLESSLESAQKELMEHRLKISEAAAVSEEAAGETSNALMMKDKKASDLRDEIVQLQKQLKKSKKDCKSLEEELSEATKLVGQLNDVKKKLQEELQYSAEEIALYEEEIAALNKLLNESLAKQQIPPSTPNNTSSERLQEVTNILQKSSADPALTSEEKPNSSRQSTAGEKPNSPSSTLEAKNELAVEDAPVEHKAVEPLEMKKIEENTSVNDETEKAESKDNAAVLASARAGTPSAGAKEDGTPLSSARAGTPSAGVKEDTLPISARTGGPGTPTAQTPIHTAPSSARPGTSDPLDPTEDNAGGGGSAAIAAVRKRRMERRLAAENANKSTESTPREKSTDITPRPGGDSSRPDSRQGSQHGKSNTTTPRRPDSAIAATDPDSIEAKIERLKARDLNAPKEEEEEEEEEENETETNPKEEVAAAVPAEKKEKKKKKKKKVVKKPEPQKRLGTVEVPTVSSSDSEESDKDEDSQHYDNLGLAKLHELNHNYNAGSKYHVHKKKRKVQLKIKATQTPSNYGVDEGVNTESVVVMTPRTASVKMKPPPPVVVAKRRNEGVGTEDGQLTDVERGLFFDEGSSGVSICSVTEPITTGDASWDTSLAALAAAMGNAGQDSQKQENKKKRRRNKYDPSRKMSVEVSLIPVGHMRYDVAPDSPPGSDEEWSDEELHHAAVQKRMVMLGGNDEATVEPVHMVMVDGKLVPASSVSATTKPTKMRPRRKRRNSIPLNFGGSVDEIEAIRASMDEMVMPPPEKNEYLRSAPENSTAFELLLREELLAIFSLEFGENKANKMINMTALVINKYCTMFRTSVDSLWDSMLNNRSGMDLHLKLVTICDGILDCRKKGANVDDITATCAKIVPIAGGTGDAAGNLAFAWQQECNINEDLVKNLLPVVNPEDGSHSFKTFLDFYLESETTRRRERAKELENGKSPRDGSTGPLKTPTSSYATPSPMIPFSQSETKPVPTIADIGAKPQAETKEVVQDAKEETGADNKESEDKRDITPSGSSTSSTGDDAESKESEPVDSKQVKEEIKDSEHKGDDSEQHAESKDSSPADTITEHKSNNEEEAAPSNTKETPLNEEEAKQLQIEQEAAEAVRIAELIAEEESHMSETELDAKHIAERLLITKDALQRMSQYIAEKGGVLNKNLVALIEEWSACKTIQVELDQRIATEKDNVRIHMEKQLGAIGKELSKMTQFYEMSLEKIKTLEPKVKELNKANAEISNMQKRLEETQYTLDTTLTNIRNQDDEIEALKNDCLAKEDELKTLNAELSTTLEQLCESQSLIETHEASIEEQKVQIQQISVARATLQAELTEVITREEERKANLQSIGTQYEGEECKEMGVQTEFFVPPMNLRTVVISKQTKSGIKKYPMVLSEKSSPPPGEANKLSEQSRSKGASSGLNGSSMMDAGNGNNRKTISFPVTGGAGAGPGGGLFGSMGGAHHSVPSTTSSIADEHHVGSLIVDIMTSESEHAAPYRGISYDQSSNAALHQQQEEQLMARAHDGHLSVSLPCNPQEEDNNTHTEGSLKSSASVGKLDLKGISSGTGDDGSVESGFLINANALGILQDLKNKAHRAGKRKGSKKDGSVDLPEVKTHHMYRLDHGEESLLSQSLKHDTTGKISALSAMSSELEAKRRVKLSARSSFSVPSMDGSLISPSGELIGSARDGKNKNRPQLLNHFLKPNTTVRHMMNPNPALSGDSPLPPLQSSRKSLIQEDNSSDPQKYGSGSRVSLSSNRSTGEEAFDDSFRDEDFKLLQQHLLPHSPPDIHMQRVAQQNISADSMSWEGNHKAPTQFGGLGGGRGEGGGDDSISLGTAFSDTLPSVGGGPGGSGSTAKGLMNDDDGRRAKEEERRESDYLLGLIANTKQQHRMEEAQHQRSMLPADLPMVSPYQPNSSASSSGQQLPSHSPSPTRRGVPAGVGGHSSLSSSFSMASSAMRSPIVGNEIDKNRAPAGNSSTRFDPGLRLNNDQPRNEADAIYSLAAPAPARIPVARTKSKKPAPTQKTIKQMQMELLNKG